jgi:thiosulfate reductase cytochrome b subunit
LIGQNVLHRNRPIKRQTASTNAITENLHLHYHKPTMDDRNAYRRHPILVRITHWINAAAFLGLVVSGVAILLAHPRLYWGETGGFGAPSILDLPLPTMLTGQSGWGRSLHFLSAWVCVLNGLVYVAYGILTRHFRANLVPARNDLRWSTIGRVIWDHLRLSPPPEDIQRYNVLQRLTYSGVIFILFPMMIWTGFAMSPAITSVFPAIVTVLNGQQSARTLHFVVAGMLVIFLGVHIAMVYLSGLRTHMRAMLTGRAGKEFRADPS